MAYKGSSLGRRSQGRTHNPTSIEKQGAPLRRIVEVMESSKNIFQPSYVRLDCGHTAYTYSRFNVRARCAECKVAVAATKSTDA